ncbi:NAD(P)-dependent oxidoreductase [Chitinophaga sp. Hz27]|uniref:NAD(P)-dependent oxidoreductase n=1 Tax=Chitinophaga sp. Hz27 TaxID=3347169 RepID=UPI0035DD48C2
MKATVENTAGAVSVIGLGDMGIRLAEILLSKGYQVTVWNRSAGKADSLAAQGAVVAESAAGAISASPVIITCVVDYSATKNILGTPETSAALKGRTLIELSTGTPQDARIAAAWAHSVGAKYLDGAILATPRQVGHEYTPIFVSGSREVYEATEPIMKALAGGLQYMGEAVGAAATWDIGFLNTVFGAITGFFQGARLFEAEGIAVNQLGDMIGKLGSVIGEMVRFEGNVIHHKKYDEVESSVKTCYNGIGLFARSAREAGITSEIPDFMYNIYQRAMDAGYGGKQVGAVIEVLR